MYTFLSIYLRSLGLSTTEVTLMATVGMIANAGAQSLLWGRALDKYRKPTEFVALGEFLAGFGHIFMVFGYQHFLAIGNTILAGYVIIFSLGGIEVFWSMSNVGWSALISELTEFDERKKVMGQLSIIGGLGGIGGAYLGGFLFDNGAGFADGSIFFIAAIVMIFSSFIVYFAIRFKDALQMQNIRIPEPVEIPSLSDLPAKLRKAYLLFIIALVFLNFGRNSISIISSLFLADPTGFGATGEQIALFSNVGSIASMLSGLLVGSVVADSDDNKVLLFGACLSIIAIAWLIISPTFLLSIVSSFLIGASHVVIQSSSYSIVAHMAPEEFRGRLFAYYNATFFLSWGIAATLVTGPIADALIGVGFRNADAYRGSFVAAILLILLGIGVLAKSIRFMRRNPHFWSEINEDMP